MEQFINLAGFLGLLTYIVVQDWRAGKLGKKENAPVEEVISKLGGDMSHLRVHYNDELTGILTTMQVRQAENSETLSDVKDILNEFQRNGIRIRQ